MTFFAVSWCIPNKNRSSFVSMFVFFLHCLKRNRFLRDDIQIKENITNLLSECVTDEQLSIVFNPLPGEKEPIAVKKMKKLFSNKKSISHR